MVQRLQKAKLIIGLVLFCWFVSLSNSTAQNFIFDYSGPDTLYVENDCVTALNWGNLTPTVVPTDPGSGQAITFFDIDDISGGYMENDDVPAGESVTVTYLAIDNQGNDSTFSFTIDFVDTIAPVFDLGTLPASGAFTCLSDVPDPPAIATIDATDNCPPPGGTDTDVTIVYNGQTGTPVLCADALFSRSWTVTDGYGNSTTYTQTITVTADNDPPTITGFPTDLTEDCASADYDAWITAQRAAFTATDGGCGSGLVLTDDAPAVINPNCSVVLVTFTATDGCSLSSTTQATYTVEDNTAPVITPPVSTDITLQCDGVPSDPITQILSWEDNLAVTENCGTVTWTNDFTDLTGGCGGTTGTATVVYTATDACGNSDMITINFEVQDSNDPDILTGAVDTTVTCDGTGNNTELISWLNNRGGAEAMDICTADGDLVLSLQDALGDPVTPADLQTELDNQLAVGCGASVTVRFAYTDACGNTSTTDADFNIDDTTDPVWDTDPVDINLECDGTNDPGMQIQDWLDNAGNGSANDECSTVSYFNDYTGLTVGCVAFTGTATVTFTAEDACGNSVNRTATVTVDDNTPPVLAGIPANVTIECGDVVPGNPGTVTASDACEGDLTGSIVYSQSTAPAATCPEVTIVTNTWSVTDACGNVSEMSQTITIEDNTPPTFSNVPADVTIECGDLIPGNPGTVTASDVCDGDVTAGIGFTQGFLVAGACNNTGTITNTWSVSDGCGNTAQATQVITIDDTTPPNITTAASDETVTCDGAGNTTALNNWLNNNGGAVATDVCNTVTWTFAITGTTTGCSGAISTTTYEFTATDDCGNTNTTSADFIIEDNVDPVFDDLPMDITVECEAPTISYAAWIAADGNGSASDACSGTNVSWSTMETSNVAGCGNTSVRTVEFTIEDECGNTASSSATYTIVDSQSPTISPTATNTSVECGSGTEQTDLNNWIASFGGAVASDGCGSISWQSFDYTTSDGGADNMVGFADLGSYPVITANDCNWSVEVTFRVADDCGNTSTTMATFSITDVTPPVISGIGADATFDCAAPTPGTPTVMDNCDAAVDVVLVADTTMQTCAHAYVITRTWTATDDCGNMATETRVLTVQDNTAPTLSGVPADATFDCDAPAPATPTASDNCTSPVTIALQVDTTFGGCLNSYVIERTWTATDVCGNSSSESQTITVQDNTNPVLMGVPADVTVSCDAIPMPATVTVTDNCDPTIMVVFNESQTPGICTHTYILTRTWEATDVCGNTVSESQTLTVEDNTAPTFLIPADVTVECDDAADLGVTGSPTNVDDTCDPAPSVTFTDVLTGGACPQSYSITRTWRVEDACGNFNTGVQNIMVEDTEAPVFTTAAQNEDYNCDTDADAETAFQTWLTNRANSVVSDNCAANPDLTWFAAVPGSYTLGDASTYPGTPVGTLDAVACPSPTIGIYRSETVDFVVYDPCGNAEVSTATFTVEDNDGPVFDFCPADVVIQAAGGVCEATYDLPAPIISDACANTTNNVALVTSGSIVSSSPGDEFTVVNPVVLTFSGLATAPTTGVDPITVIITLLNVDGEQPTEYFNILGEDGSNLGTTNLTSGQCGNSTTAITIPATDFNIWAADGDLTITLDPHVEVGQTNNFAINDICAGSSVAQAALNYTSNTPTGLIFSYNVNGGPFNVVNPIADIPSLFEVGDNVIIYRATDCAGNVTDCTFTVSVVDSDPPVVTCPSDITVALTATDDCAAGVDVMLPLPIATSDNCGFQSTTLVQPTNPADALLTFSLEPNYQEYMADDKVIVFPGTAADAAGGNVSLTVTITGDAEDAEEFFTIVAEDNTILGTTESGQANVSVNTQSCPDLSVITATFNISVTQYNIWAADGSVSFTAESNMSFAAPAPGGSSDGVNPACTTFPGGTPDGTADGQSSLIMTLMYDIVAPSYYITGATDVPLTNMLPPVIAPTETFNLGVSTVFYIIEDESSNADTCSFTVTIEDNIAPDVVCQPTTIFVNPSGAADYILDPTEVDGGSSDNCGIDTMTVSPNTFTCNDAGSVVTVTLTVTDESGNTATCDAQVSIQTEGPAPSYSIGLCGNDTLSLFANPPAATGGVLYTYLWSGPNGFVSTLENPQIPNADVTNSGSYAVTVTGVTGCTALGTVEVTINATPDVPVLDVNSNDLCTNDDLVLTTQTFAGTNVTYNWYNGIFPGGTLVATTTLPTFTVFSPLPPGTLTYYVIVEVDGCVSEASFFQTIEVTEAPVATVNDAVITVCEGESFTVGTMETGAGYTYDWTGPNGFSSNLQNPAAVTATTFDAGTYTLVISANGCPATATTEVIVNETPSQPILASSGVACEGDDLTLFTNINGADLYTWTAPDFTTQVTTDNSLVLTNVDQSLAGNWTVMVTINGCDSEMSAPIEVFVENELTVQAANNGPVCSNENIQLSANTIPGATYVWSGPNGFSSLEQNPEAPAIGGTYSVTVTTTSGCSNMATTVVSVETAPVITALSNNGAGCVTGADDIQLIATIFPPDPGDYQYFWIGPNGFSSVQAVPTLPNGTSIDNGSYTLVVTNANGCSSLPVTNVVNVSDAPITPAIVAPTSICTGDLLNISTDGYVGTTVVYNWVTPLGTIQTPTPSLTIVDPNELNSGNYSVFVTVDGCESNVSGSVNITVSPTPGTPLAAVNSPLCVGETIELNTTFIPGATYQWIGPAGFTADVFNPVIFDATEDNAGSYSVQVTLNNCSSAFSAPVTVVVSESPAAPSVQNNGPICIDEPGASLVLSVNPADAVPGASYTWFDAQTNEQVGGPTTALNVTLTDFSNYGEGLFDFYVVADLNGCASPSSIPTSVAMSSIPDNQAFAGEDDEVCNAGSFSLDATAPTIGTGEWTQISGPTATISNPNSANSPVTGLVPGNTYIFRWTLSNGACIDYDFDEVTITVNSTTEEAEAGINIDVCNTTTAFLDATVSTTGATGVWSQSPSQSAEGVVIVDSTDPNTEVTGLSPNQTYTFTWTLSNDGCGEFDSDDVEVTVEQSSVVAFAGADTETCGDGELQLDATPPSSGIGTWTTDDPELVIIDANDPTTLVQGATGGFYTFTWTLDNGACGTTSDEVIIEYELSPIAEDDIVTVSYASDASFNVLDNDLIEGTYFLEVIGGPNGGTLNDQGNGDFTYSPRTSFAGTDEFRYRICSQICPDECSEATVFLRIGEDAECIPPTIFTPNNDGVNDAFVIPCLATDQYPQNVVSIFNQWGDEVFRSAPYTNNWMGTYNGEDLPVGTYYYVIDFGNGIAPVSGFLILER